ncbi:MAG TPA: addiction module protein [Rhodanobacteraceae bacterium]|nr:addiction module protein [Rhodanobacteraceae bacterium]
MDTRNVLEQVLKLDPARRYELAEEILHSLDQPDPVIDAAWIEEAERRLAAYRAGAARGIPAEDVLGPL